MNNEDKNSISNNFKNNNVAKQNEFYSLKDAIEEFEELKQIALSCVDKNGNPNISAAIRAIENKAKIAGLYSAKNSQEIKNVVNMTEITVDGKQLKLNIGEDFG